MILLIGALNDEVTAIRKCLTNIKGVEVGRGWRLWSGKLAAHSILLLQTGIGKFQAQASASAVLGRFPVSGIVNFGYGGAAVPGFAAGDLVLCSTISAPEARGGLQPFHSHPEWVRLARLNMPKPIRTGGCLTVEQLVTQPKDKRKLGEEYPILVMDMEGYALAQMADRFRIPFLAVKTISDTLEETLPPFDEWMLPQGGLRWQKATNYWLSHPQDLIVLFKVYRNTRHARARLAEWIRLVIPCLAEEEIYANHNSSGVPLEQPGSRAKPGS